MNPWIKPHLNATQPFRMQETIRSLHCLSQVRRRCLCACHGSFPTNTEPFPLSDNAVPCLCGAQPWKTKTHSLFLGAREALASFTQGLMALA